MGILDIFKPQNTTPIVTSILPDIAKQEILNGRLPILKTSRIFLKNGELCHYMDSAVYEKRTVKKQYIRHNAGYSMPGLMGGTRINMGGGKTDAVDNVQYEQIWGTLYITNQRIIFVGETDGFDKKINDLIAVTPYSNAVEMHFSKDIFKVFVSDGNIAYHVLQQVG